MTDSAIVHKPKNGFVADLSNLQSILTVISGNKQSSPRGKTMYPPEKYPIMWYIGFENDEFGNEVADKMLEKVKGLKGEPIRFDEYMGRVGRHLHLYFQGIEIFNSFAETFIRNEAVTVEFFGGRVESWSLNQFKSEAAQACEIPSNDPSNPKR